MSLARRLFDPLLDQIFPPQCVSCGAGGALLCASCQATIRAPEPPLCNHCGVSLAGMLSSTQAPGLTSLCQSCVEGRGPASLTALRVAAVYEGAIREAILALKFRRQRRAAQPLGMLLAAQVRLLGWQPEVILPIPLHADRVRWRGYNQSELLAHECARELGVPQRADLLVRQRDTRPQIGLTAAERQANVADAFALAAQEATVLLAGRRILLVDDVATTGSTLDAAASALLVVRPAAIWGIAVSRPDLAADNANAQANASAAYPIVSPVRPLR